MECPDSLSGHSLTIRSARLARLPRPGRPRWSSTRTRAETVASRLRRDAARPRAPGSLRSWRENAPCGIPNARSTKYLYIVRSPRDRTNRLNDRLAGHFWISGWRRTRTGRMASVLARPAVRRSCDRSARRDLLATRSSGTPPRPSILCSGSRSLGFVKISKIFAMRWNRDQSGRSNRSATCGRCSPWRLRAIYATTPAVKHYRRH
jgi:hypothetical protein